MDTNDKIICGAKTRSGKPCQKPPMLGRERCRIHGGATPVGTHTGNTHAVRHGIYSRQFTDEELALIPEMRETVGLLEDEIILTRMQLRRAVELDERIRAGEVQAGMRLSEMRRVQKTRRMGQDQNGAEVMQDDGTEDHIVRRVPDTQELILKLTGRIQGLVATMHGVHIERVERMRALLAQRITEVEDLRRRLQQFGIVQGGRNQA